MVEPPEEETVFLVIECPSESYIKNLAENRQLNHYLKAAPQLVLHLTKPNICDNEGYIKWVKMYVNICVFILLLVSGLARLLI